ncbi:hypothetical protein, partial [Streptomyces sp. NPDC058605]|uniref:hypothetical protein n=1 Tax=Streptomyces sp. NPDC058605 TaxID=3346552 RepID=UPI0036520B57
RLAGLGVVAAAARCLSEPGFSLTTRRRMPAGRRPHGRGTRNCFPGERVLTARPPAKPSDSPALP